MADNFDNVANSKYLLLNTFTKDGRPKPTPVWGVADGDKLLVITDDGSWKTKRIRNTPRVTIQRSYALGKPKGEPVEAVARNLPKSETRRVYDAVIKRYWWHAWWFIALDGAWGHRQGAQRDRDHTGLIRRRQMLVEEREDTAVGVLGRRVVVAESGDPQ